MSFIFDFNARAPGLVLISGCMRPSRLSSAWLNDHWDQIASSARAWRGEFALLAWHAQRDEGVALRDPLGVKPLYALTSHGSLKISTELGPLLKGPHRLTPNHGYLERIQNSDFSALEETPFNEIRRCPPGTLWRIRDGKLLSEPYFDFADIKSTETFKNKDQWLEVGRRLLFEVVRRRTSPGRRHGVFLSGGLDSSLVARLLDEGGVDVTAFSMVDDRFEEGDKKSLAATAAQLRGPHHLTSLAEAEELDLLSDPTSFNGIFYDPCLWLYRPLLRSAKEMNIGTIFTGLGGDDVFQPNWEYLSSILSRERLGPILRKLRSESQELPWLSSLWRFLIRPRIRQWLSGSGLDPVSNNLFHRFFKSGAYTFAMEQEQELASHFGVAMSYPLLDLDLMSYVMATPPELFFDESLEKIWLRRLAQGLVDRQVTGRMSTQNYDALRARVLISQKSRILDSLRDAQIEENAKSNDETLLKKYYSSQCILQSRWEESP